MSNFWRNLPHPFFILAPMDDVTDTVFREIVNHVAPADVNFTEFASSDGFMHPSGRPSVERRLQVNETEKAQQTPLIAQIWGATPDHYLKMAKDLAARNTFAGIDINMGCPEKGIVRRGCCGGLIKEDSWQNAADIIQATKAEAGNLPVSVKTRIGLNRIVTEAWAGHLLQQDIAALTIHARTVKEMSRVPAHWEEIAKVVVVRDQVAPQTVIIGNGDINNRAHGLELAEQTGADGIMIGRGILKDIGAFAKYPLKKSPQERIDLLQMHLNLYEQTWNDGKSYEPMKKFAKLYINGYPGAADLRAQIMETKSADEARDILGALVS